MNSILSKHKSKAPFLVFGLMSLILILEGFFQWKIHVLLWENSHVMSGLIQTEWFYVSNQRVGMYFTQILPFIGLKLNLPDILVLILQSFNYVLLPLILIGWVIFRWKDLPHGIFIFFVLTLGGFYIHFAKEYSMVNSLVYGLVLASFINSVFDSKRWMHYVILIGFLVMIAYTFTLSMFFIVPLLLVNHKKLGVKTLLLAFATVGAVFVITFIQSNYIMNNVAAVGSDGISAQGIHAVVQSLKKVGLYYSTIVLLIITITIIALRKSNYVMLFVWGIHLVFLAIALRYLIAVCGQTFAFDISNLVLTRVEATLFIIVASIIYFSCRQLGWHQNLLLLLFVLSIGRFVFLNISAEPVNEIISEKEYLVKTLSNDYPDKKVFLVSRNCDFIPKNYELDDFKHESFIISTYLGRPTITYLTNHFEYYDDQGRPQFVNKNTDASVDLYEESTYAWRFDPILEYPKMNIQFDEIETIICK